MLEKIKDVYVKKAKQAYHTVVHSVWEYMPFFVCIFAMIFSLVTVSTVYKSSYASKKAIAEESYDYHVLVSGLDEVGMNVIYKQKYSVFTNDMVYELVRTVRHYSVESGTKTYDMYLRLLTGNKSYDLVESLSHKDTLEENLDTFKENYKTVLFSEQNGKHVQITPSPLYELEALEREYAWREAFALLCAAAIFTVILLFFYRTRVNNKRFLYGVYASFGADRRRLSGTSVLEICVCALFTVIPASVAAYIFCRLVIPNGYRVFDFELSSVFASLPFALVAIIVSVYLPIREASRSEAISLISSDDNSNLVSVPWRSVNMRKRSFPLGYEGISLLRFRRRLAGLLLLSVILCSTFVSSVYAVDLYAESAGTKAAMLSDFSIELPHNIPQSVLTDIEAIDGVHNARITHTSLPAIDRESHILVEKEKTVGNKLHGYTENEGYIINDDLTYYSSADGGIAELLADTYEIEGDIYSAEGYSVIIGDTYDNEKAYNLKVGDKVLIGIYLGSKEELQKKSEAEANGEEYIPSTEKPREEDMFLATGNDRLDLMVEKGAYEYVSCTVGGIIHGYPSSLYGTPIIMSDALFERVTGITPKRTTAEIDLLEERALNVAEIESAIRDILQEYPDARLTSSGIYYASLAERAQSYDVMIRAASVVCILLIPVMWLYSQILFYRRRQGEFDLLESLSAYYRDIRRLHMADALILGGVALVSLPLSVGCVRLMHHLYNYTIPTKFLSGANVIVTPNIPLSEYIAVALCSAASALLASVAPYILFRVAKRRKEIKSLQINEVTK